MPLVEPVTIAALPANMTVSKSPRHSSSFAIVSRSKPPHICPIKAAELRSKQRVDAAVRRNAMYVLDNLKKSLEKVTGIGKPGTRAARNAVHKRKAHKAMFKDDGVIPNNPRLPFVHYRTPVDLSKSGDPAAVFEELFRSNGWSDAWRNGIYDYVHYHSSIHEVLGIARGQAKVRFGGSKGKTIDLRPGDVAILPAGTGHQRLSASDDLLVVGAYPSAGKYDECTGSAQERETALRSIPKVPLPAKDPVYGPGGPLRSAWRRSKRS
jgi:uncharacterized protein YjlB